MRVLIYDRHSDAVIVYEVDTVRIVGMHLELRSERHFTKIPLKQGTLDPSRHLLRSLTKDGHANFSAYCEGYG